MSTSSSDRRCVLAAALSTAVQDSAAVQLMLDGGIDVALATCPRTCAVLYPAARGLLQRLLAAEAHAMRALASDYCGAAGSNHSAERYLSMSARNTASETTQRGFAHGSRKRCPLRQPDIGSKGSSTPRPAKRRTASGRPRCVSAPLEAADVLEHTDAPDGVQCPASDSGNVLASNLPCMKFIALIGGKSRKQNTILVSCPAMSNLSAYRIRKGEPPRPEVQHHVDEAMQPDGIDLEYVYLPGASRPESAASWRANAPLHPGRISYRHRPASASASRDQAGPGLPGQERSAGILANHQNTLALEALCWHSTEQKHSKDKRRPATASAKLRTGMSHTLGATDFYDWDHGKQQRYNDAHRTAPEHAWAGAWRSLPHVSQSQHAATWALDALQHFSITPSDALTTNAGMHQVQHALDSDEDDVAPSTAVDIGQAAHVHKAFAAGRSAAALQAPKRTVQQNLEDVRVPSAGALGSSNLAVLLQHANQCALALGSKWRYVAVRVRPSSASALQRGKAAAILQVERRTVVRIWRLLRQ